MADPREQLDLAEIRERAIFRERVIRRVNESFQPGDGQNPEKVAAFLREICDAAYDVAHEKP